MVGILNASGAPRGFFGVLTYMLAASPDCGVRLLELEASGT